MQIYVKNMLKKHFQLDNRDPACENWCADLNERILRNLPNVRDRKWQHMVHEEQFNDL